MKKFTFILFALIVGTTFAQNSVDGTATVNAHIVSPIGVKSSDNINFGKIVKTEDGGVVEIPTDGGARIISKSMDIESDPATAATFNVTAEENTTYSVLIPQLTMKNTADESQTMTVDFTHSLGEGNTSSGNTAKSFVVGGKLNVGGNQAEGSYTGTATVTVSYE